MIAIEQLNIDPEALSRQPDCDFLEIITTRNLVLFPGVIVNFELGRKPALELARRAKHAAFPIGIVCQVDPEEDNPKITSGIYKYGVFADVIDVREDIAEQPIAIVRARGRFRVLGKAKMDGDVMPYTVRVKELDDIKPVNEREYANLVTAIRESATEALTKSGDPQSLLQGIASVKDGDALVNILATHLPIETEAKITMLSKSKLADRAKELLAQLSLFTDRVKITEEIMNKARRTMDENQRNAFLQSQMDAIREKLYGEDDEEISELLEKAKVSGMPDAVFAKFEKDVDKLRRFHPSSPDYSVLFSYLETLNSLPWKAQTVENYDIDFAEKHLNEDHYGLDKLKERIIEHLATTMASNGHVKGPILCLVGPPGVGKTSIGKAIAESMMRKYERVSFGGLHDESEIRGHRRTYIGAMPGRIIDAMRRAEVNNPLILLDEVDKVGQDYKGDPAAALLEVLDPEQNCHFHDNYIDVDFDLSKVLFIATANTTSSIPKPLLDRMEVIELPGYLAEEKIEIARRHLIPRILTNMQGAADGLDIPDDTILEIITRYTAEAGVRELEKKLNAIARKKVVASLKGIEFPTPVLPEHLYDLLGLAPRLPELPEKEPIAGVVTGLAWTEVGGEILMAEVSLSPAKEGSLTMTGNLGNVMKESATLAYQWIKAHAEDAGINRDILNTHAVHVHFPEGAVPKDGPSAGITITTAMVSALTGKPVRSNLAMTGEISLRGRVLPVGGIREKILAAKRAGITDIVMCERNRRDIEDMAAGYRQGLNFHYAETIGEVLRFAIPE